MKEHHLICIVDDEPPMLRALGRLLRSAGYEVRAFESAESALAGLQELDADCLLLDVHMPGGDGLALQETLHTHAPDLPIVFLTGRGDIPMTVRAMRRGAINFLTKPVQDTSLLEAVEAAVALSRRRKAESQARAQERERLSTLTPRERQVLSQVIAGKLNKQIADALGTSLQTIKVHRMRVHEKMGVPSAAELTRIASRLGVEPAAD